MPARTRRPAPPDRVHGDALWLAIAHPTRRAMLERIADATDDAPCTVASLRAAFPDLSAPAVTQHLNVLRLAGLVTDRREGRTVVVSLDPTPLLELTAWLDGFTARWRHQLDRLGAYLASTTIAQPARRRRSP